MSIIKLANKGVDFIKQHPFAIGGTLLGGTLGAIPSENAVGNKLSKTHRAVNTIGGALGLGITGYSFDAVRNQMKNAVKQLEAEMATQETKPIVNQTYASIAKKNGFRRQ